MVKNLCLIFGIAFLLNAVWEHAHLLLYTCALKPYVEMAAMMWQATAGDALITVLLYLGCAAVFRDLNWFRRDRLWLPAMLGFVIAVGIEYHAVFLAHRWAYNAWMPVVAGIGVTPVLQMLILPGLSYWLAEFRRPGV